MPTLFVILTAALALAMPQHPVQDGIAVPQERWVDGQAAVYSRQETGMQYSELNSSQDWMHPSSVPYLSTDEMAPQNRVLSFGMPQKMLVKDMPGFVHQYDETPATISYRPHGGIVVSVDAEAVFKHALVQSWNCVNDRLGRRQVNGKMFSKVDYQIKPTPSLDGALLRIFMDGVSFGESTAMRTEKSKVIVDTLTNFQSRQMLLLRATGVEYGPLDLAVDASQKYNRTTSSNPFASTLAKRVLKNPSENLKAQTNAFAKKHIERNVSRHLAMTYRNGVESINRMFTRIPMLQRFSWSMSSDENFIYAAADSYELPMQMLDSEHVGLASYNQSAYPVTITVNDDVATNLLNEQLANKQVGSLGLESQYDAMSKFLHLPKLEVKNDKYWTIDFGQHPGRVQFGEESIHCELQADKIASDEQSINNMIVGFTVRPLYQNGYWYLVRDEKVTVRRADDESGRLGARQLAFRTVMSKRLERVIPQYVALKRVPTNTNQQNALDLELSLDKIQPSFGQMTFGFKTK